MCGCHVSILLNMYGACAYKRLTDGQADRQIERGTKDEANPGAGKKTDKREGTAGMD